ncbi:hypothetical protein [Bradyrhizobium sp. 27S5]|uniref:hypothetical protein n=1 Tax=Bradyrhizobium sp. 27S5 TaxID=3139728 RepID=UPI0030D3B684
MRRIAAIALVLTAAVIAEEVTRGTLLGLRPLWPLCDTIGGKHATNAVSTRCLTRVCYWLGDCGQWAAPVDWTNRVAPGDPVSKLVLWLGEPERRDGADLLWSYGKGGDGMFRAVIADGHLVNLQDEKTQAPLRGAQQRQQ